MSKAQLGTWSNTPCTDKDSCKSQITQDNHTSYYYTPAFQSVWSVQSVTKQEIAPFLDALKRSRLGHASNPLYVGEIAPF